MDIKAKSESEISMSIIILAGDARVFCKECLDAISINNFELANEKLKASKKKIKEANSLQTDAIQCQAQGDKSEYSFLFAHAQDTLMTIHSEIDIAKQMIKIFEQYEKSN